MPKSNKPIDVVFCGAIRLPDRFKESIKSLLKLKKEGIVGQIIFSTWDYEIKNYPGMRDFLKNSKVILVEGKEPENPGLGYIWNQMKSLDSGLKRARSNSFVLKTRPDVFIRPSFIKKLATSKDLSITSPLPKGNVFKYKVWVPWYEPTTPFYMEDICFFGHRDDLKLLVNYEQSYDKYENVAGVVHIRRFMHPFIKKYPMLQDFLVSNNNVGFPSHTLINRAIARICKGRPSLESLRTKYRLHHRFNVLNKKIHDEEYLKILAAYYAIIHSHFYIDNKESPIEFRDYLSYRPLDNTSLESNFTKDKVTMPAMGQIYVFDDILLKNIMKRKLKDTPLSQKLYSALDSFNKK
ncbi:hypothetical protein KW805_04175 [Candidatus Pacearchaeota archaeon]|nr:hypothetical protein [Candidatus Pacearchaeota archaeon]